MASGLGHPFLWLRGTVKTVAAAHLFWAYGYAMGPASGPSMLPTIESWGEWLLVSKRHRHGRHLRVGDLVVYTVPIYPDTEGVKRVLGLPGDYVLMNSPDSDGDVMIQVCGPPSS